MEERIDVVELGRRIARAGRLTRPVAFRRKSFQIAPEFRVVLARDWIHLRGLTGLQKLFLETLIFMNTKVTDAGIKELTEALPELAK